MLSITITVLFTFSGVFAIAVIAYSLAAARVAYGRLMLEGEVLRAELALGASAIEASLRLTNVAAPRRLAATRRPAGLRPHPLRSPLQACAA